MITLSSYGGGFHMNENGLSVEHLPVCICEASEFLNRIKYDIFRECVDEPFSVILMKQKISFLSARFKKVLSFSCDGDILNLRIGPVFHIFFGVCIDIKDIQVVG